MLFRSIRALSNNVSIAVESFNSKVKKETVMESLSEFDAALGLELSTGRKTQQLASAFSSPNRMANDNDNWDLSLSQKLVQEQTINLISQIIEIKRTVKQQDSIQAIVLNFN